jgi:hypothetical protein
MPTKFDTRQSINHTILARLSGVADTELDDLLASINTEVSPPLAISCVGTNRVVNISNILAVNSATGLTRTIPPISNTLPVFASGTVTLSSGGAPCTATPSVGTPYVFTVASGNYIKLGINIDATGSLVLQAGIEGASAAAATVPPTVSNTFAIGYVIVHNTGGTIDNIITSTLVQFAGGGGGSGSGTGNPILETIKNDFVDSPYNLVTPIIASDDQSTLIATYGGTASYDLVTGSYKFAAISDAITSVNMLDSLEFVNDFKDVWDVRTELFYKAGSIDTTATLQVSRDGGAHFLTSPLTRVGNNTEAFYSDYKWAREEEDAVTVSNATGTTDTVANATTQQSLSAKFVYTANTRLTTVTAKLKRLGTTLGSYRFAIYSDNSGVPGTRLYSSNYILTSTLPTSAANQTWDVNGQGILASLTANVSYHLVIETDATYKAGFSSGVTEMYWVRDNTTGTALAYSFNGTAWSVFTTSTFVSAETGGQESFVSVSTYSVANADSSVTLNATTEQRLSQAFTLASQQVVKQAVLYLNQLGSPVGNFTVQIIKDSSGSPSTSYSDIYAMSSSFAANQGASGNFTFTASMPTTVLPAGTYHLVLVPDATYATNSFGSHALLWRDDISAPPAPQGKRFNGTVWSALATSGSFVYLLNGRPMDLRFRLTAGTASTFLSGAAVYYDKEVVGVSGGTKKIQSFRFFAVANNTNTFAITAFLPDPDLLKVYHAETGQVYTYPAFDMQGYSIVFPVNTFNNGGVETTVTLRFEQTEGYAFDNAEKNASLLASNRLGSSDASIDRSQAGRGIILRNAAGVLREISLDANDNIIISTVP